MACALLLGLSGCIDGPGGGVELPPPPNSLQASYAVSAGGQSLGALDVRGMEEGSGLDAAGRPTAGPALVAELAAPVGVARSYTYTLLLASPDLLGTGSVQCSGADCGAAANRRVDLPGLSAQPSFLGAGPFLGRTLREGDVIRVGPPGLAGEGAEWVIRSSPHWNGRDCVLATSVSGAAGLPIPLVPARGEIQLCEGLPLPVTIRAYGVDLRLSGLAFEGRLRLAPAGAGTPRPPEVCSGSLPPHDRETLPTTTYLAWARQNDPRTKEFLAEHPGAVAYPGYGRVLEKHEAPLYQYRVSALIPLHDPGRGILEALEGGETWDVTPLGAQGKMVEAAPIGGFAREVEAPEASCLAPGALESNSERIVRLSGIPTRSYFAFLAPRALASFQGYPAPLGPFTATAQMLPPGELPSSPMRAYLLGGPSGGPVLETWHASFDPATGSLEWVERAT